MENAKDVNEKESVKNLLVFGRTSSGKSTLSGYLYYYSNQDEATTLLEKTKREFSCKNIKFSSDDQFSYIMDSAFESSRKYGKDGKEGTTVDLKIRHVNEIKLNIIDSPGIGYRFTTQKNQKRLSEKKNSRINQGITISDIGIFTIEARDFKKIEEEEGQYAFNRLFDFISRKGEENVIIALTKCDTFLKEKDKLKEIYESCKSYIEEVFNFKNCWIIPIGIIASDMRDINVLQKSDVFDFYEGPSLLKAINDCTKITENNSKENPFSYALVQREFNITGIGKVWRCKMVKDSFFVNDEVILGPVKINKKMTAIRGKIKNLQNTNKINTDFVSKGEIFGVDVSFNKEKSSINMDKTISFLIKYDEKIIFKIGNYLEISDIEKELPLDRVEYVLNWYGKKIRCFLREKSKNCLEVILEKNIVVPFYQSVMFDSFVSICLENDLKQYLTGKIKDLLKIDDIYLQGKEKKLSYNEMRANKDFISFNLNSSLLDLEK